MSTGIELAPIAIRIGAAVAARRLARGRRTTVGETAVQTLTSRMRDEALLTAAVETLGEMFGERHGLLYGSVDGRAVVFERSDDGTFDVHLEAAVPADQAEALVRELDRAYGACVQRQTYERVAAQATDYGLTLESEDVDSDDAIVLRLRVVEGP